MNDDYMVEIPRRAVASVIALLRDRYGISQLADWYVRTTGLRTILEMVDHIGLTGERRDSVARDVLTLVRAYQGEDRRSLPLAPDEWAALERIAAETQSLAERGSNAGIASWRTLIRRIANGELVVRYIVV